jgi:hypothetical protein
MFNPSDFWGFTSYRSHFLDYVTIHNDEVSNVKVMDAWLGHLPVTKPFPTGQLHNINWDNIKTIDVNDLYPDWGIFKAIHELTKTGDGMFKIICPVDEHTCDVCRSYNGIRIETESMAIFVLKLIHSMHEPGDEEPSECRCRIEPVSSIEQGAVAGRKLRIVMHKQINSIENCIENSKIISQRMYEMKDFLFQLKFHQEILWMDQILEYIKHTLNLYLIEKKQMENPKLICTCDVPNLVCQIHKDGD